MRTVSSPFWSNHLSGLGKSLLDFNTSCLPPFPCLKRWERIKAGFSLSTSNGSLTRNLPSLLPWNMKFQQNFNKLDKSWMQAIALVVQTVPRSVLHCKLCTPLSQTLCPFLLHLRKQTKIQRENSFSCLTVVVFSGQEETEP